MGQVEELIKKKLKEQRGPTIDPIKKRSSYPFTVALIAEWILKNVVARLIPEYNDGRDPIIHVSNHQASLMGKSFDDNHLAILFLSTLSGSASTWFFGLLAKLIGSWSELKSKFLECYMGECQLLKNVIALAQSNNNHGETPADFYGCFHNNITDG